MEQRLSLITLGVADLARARRFYEDGLGWTKGNPEEEVAFYQLGGMVLALWTRADLAVDAGIEDTGAPFGGIALAFNTRSRAEVDDVIGTAVAAGGTSVKPGTATEWGGYSGYFRDPDGHLWEVAHNPGWTVDEAGRTLLGS